MSLGELIGQSDSIVIGVVMKTLPPTPLGASAVVSVRETLKGSKRKLLLLLTSSTDPTLAELHPGETILAFVKEQSALPDMTSVVGQEPPFTTVGGESGVMTLTEAALRSTREIVKKAIKRGMTLRLADVDSMLMKPGVPAATPPPVLIASLTEYLSQTLTADEWGALATVACDPALVYLPAVRLWAISLAGVRRIPQATACLEESVGPDEDRAVAIAAAQALGDLGDPGALRALLSVLPAGTPGGPIGNDMVALLPPGDDDGEATSGGRKDAEDETPLTGGLLRDEEIKPGVPPADEDHDSGAERAEEPFHRSADSGLSDAAILALGKIGDPAAVATLSAIAAEGDDLALHSTVVHALGLIGGSAAEDALTAIRDNHPNELVRDQARRTLVRLGG